MAAHATTRHTQPRPTRPAYAAARPPEVGTVRAPHTADFPVIMDSIGNRCRVTALSIVVLLAIVLALVLL
ncbi:hypothetical protein [Gordonia sp. (in: high G+C Gram-positive bacteria)]|jgi:hypothetical protein|uniref:hypothetical protein n=1 Tax=Gordonia sp. (in: high G+C Gram-positive bacteria) TaxID=84139 RepID=UPI001D6CDB38|nr:hypothetical protein [Gordonia sp. (in: high G+C Gram-positive bacteria)]MCB1293707.1 hypothetical protein [Gordonia sp. (in: high G+C Gram-positive bacteria)]HMS75912.1 hypothetical protein [Gordonia sp. (in: high G+C Gram-positive bacteria)]HQV19035.1 hypothetical protein [Gordonia sp. (in: high G+C Gram-positive bacteria)]